MNEKELDKMPKIFGMGYGYLPKAVMKCQNLSIKSKAVYSYLISYAGREGIAYPSRKLMCYDLKISQDTLNKCINELVSQKLIAKVQQRDKNRFSKNEYHFNYHMPPDILITKNPDTENINTNMSQNSVSENSGNELTDNETTVTNNNNKNNNIDNINKNFTNNIIENNKNNNINKKRENSLQDLKSIVTNYISYDEKLVSLIKDFIDFREEKGKPFENEKDFSHFIDSLKTIKGIEGKIDCLLYSLNGKYTTIFPERYRDKYKNKKMLSDEYLERLCKNMK